MRKSIALCAACVLMAAALPAAAMSPPGKELVRLRHQVTALKAKVRRLQAENTALAGEASLTFVVLVLRA